MLSIYVGINLKVRGSMDERSILYITDTDLKSPKDPDDTAGKVAFLKWETEFNDISRNKLTWEENHQNIFNLYLQHCTKVMGSRLKSMNEWARYEVNQDGIALINMIRSIRNKHYRSRQGVMKILQYDKRMLLTHKLLICLTHNIWINSRHASTLLRHTVVHQEYTRF